VPMAQQPTIAVPVPVQPAVLIPSATQTLEPAHSENWDRAFASANTLAPQTQQAMPQISVPEYQPPDQDAPAIIIPAAKAFEPSPGPFVIPSVQSKILADRVARIVEQQPASTGISSSRIYAALSKAETRIIPELAPILPAPEPVVHKHVEPSILSDIVPPSDHHIHASTRRKIAPSDPELEHVMRMVAALPSLEERAEYLEEAARYEVMQATTATQQQPTEDLEALAMQHVASFQDTSREHVSSTVDTDFDTAVAHGGGPTGDPGFPLEHSEVAADVADGNIMPETVVAPEHIEGSIEAQRIEPMPTAPVVRQRVEPEMPASFARMSDAEVEDLSRSLLDMMASSASTGLPQERALAADTLLRILPRLSIRPLVNLAQRISMMDQPPIRIASKLLLDHRIEVAGPLLEDATSIPDQELFPVIEENETQKLRLLARRRKLSRAITDVLAKCNNSSVLLTLVRNSHAEISHNGFLILTAQAENHPDLLAPLCTRADLPAPQAFELFWMAPVQLRRYLLSRFLTDSQTLTKILKITLATQGDRLSTEEFPEADRTVDAFGHALNGDMERAANHVAELAQIDSATAMRILSDSSGEAIVALLKGIGFPRSSLEEFLTALQRVDNGLLSPLREISELEALFDTLSFNKARILLTYWDWSTLKTGPYAAAN
jgi:uncharacterized protein (DUF2336 family)